MFSFANEHVHCFAFETINLHPKWNTKDQKTMYIKARSDYSDSAVTSD